MHTKVMLESALVARVARGVAAARPMVQVEVLGEPEVVMRYRTDSCRVAGSLDRGLLRVQLRFTLAP